MWHVIGFYHRGHCWDLNWGIRRRWLWSALTWEVSTKAELLAEQVTSSPLGQAVNRYAVEKGGEGVVQNWLSTAQARLGWKAEGKSKNSNGHPACALLTVWSWWQKSHWRQSSGQGFVLPVISNVCSYSWKCGCMLTSSKDVLKSTLRTDSATYNRHKLLCALSVACVDPYGCVACERVWNIFKCYPSTTTCLLKILRFIYLVFSHIHALKQISLKSWLVRSTFFT